MPHRPEADCARAGPGTRCRRGRARNRSGPICGSCERVHVGRVLVAHHVPRGGPAGHRQRPPAGDRPAPDLARLRPVRLGPDRPDSPNRQFTFDPRDARRGDRLARPQRPHRPAPLPGPAPATTGRSTSRRPPATSPASCSATAPGSSARTCATPISGIRTSRPPEPLFELLDVEWVVEQLHRAALRRADARSCPG